MPSHYPAPTSAEEFYWPHRSWMPEFLDEAKPLIWRRLLVPGDMPLDRFWVGTHRGDGREFLSDWVLSEGEVGIAESDVRLDQVLSQKGDTLRYDYDYDFGDGWRHTILVEELLEEKIPGPSYTTVRRAGPPEDCGWLEEGLGPNHFDVSGINERLALLVRAEHDRSAIPLGDMFGGTASITWP